MSSQDCLSVNGFRGLEPVCVLVIYHTTCRLLTTDDHWDEPVLSNEEDPDTYMFNLVAGGLSGLQMQLLLLRKVGCVYIRMMYLSCGVSIAETLKTTLHGELAVYMFKACTFVYNLYNFVCNLGDFICYFPGWSTSSPLQHWVAISVMFFLRPVFNSSAHRTIIYQLLGVLDLFLSVTYVINYLVQFSEIKWTKIFRMFFVYCISWDHPLWFAFKTSKIGVFDSQQYY